MHVKLSVQIFTELPLDPSSLSRVSVLCVFDEVIQEFRNTFGLTRFSIKVLYAELVKRDKLIQCYVT